MMMLSRHIKSAILTSKRQTISAARCRSTAIANAAHAPAVVATSAFSSASKVDGGNIIQLTIRSEQLPLQPMPFDPSHLD